MGEHGTISKRDIEAFSIDYSVKLAQRRQAYCNAPVAMGNAGPSVLIMCVSHNVLWKDGSTE